MGKGRIRWRVKLTGPPKLAVWGKLGSENGNSEASLLLCSGNILLLVAKAFPTGSLLPWPASHLCFCPPYSHRGTFQSPDRLREPLGISPIHLQPPSGLGLSSPSSLGFPVFPGCSYAAITSGSQGRGPPRCPAGHNEWLVKMEAETLELSHVA